MEPYKPNKPFIQMKLDGSLLDRMVEAGIPLSRALQYFRDNPEGSALETLKTAAEDVVPFYGNYRNGGDWSDYAKEAALMFVPGGPKNVYNPSRGVRQPVRTTKKGEPNKKDLKQWADYTVSKWNDVYGNAVRHKYNDPVYKADQLGKSVERAQYDINSIQREIDNIITERNLPADQRGLSVEWYDKKLESAQNRLETAQKQYVKLLNDYNAASIDALGYTPREKNWEGVVKDLDRDYLYNGGGTGYMLDKLKAEYGDALGKKYFNDIVDQSYKDYKKDPWNRVNSDYPFAQRLLKEHGEL